eukprot:12243767-Alexandrium_andersonii.AAC.1
MATSEKCFALVPDTQWEKCIHFHVFDAQDLTPFRELSSNHAREGGRDATANSSPDNDFPWQYPAGKTFAF